MPKEHEGETPNPTDEQPPVTDPPADDQPNDDEPFDKERAMATIKTQRESEREAKRQLDEANRKLAKVQSELDERKRAEMNDVERLQADLDAATAKLADYDQHKARADRYEAALQTYLDENRKDVPSHIIVLLDKMDPVDQLDYITANRDEWSKKSSTNGVPATPKADHDPSLSIEQKRERGGYYRTRF